MAFAFGKTPNFAKKDSHAIDQQIHRERETRKKHTWWVVSGAEKSGTSTLIRTLQTLGDIKDNVVPPPGLPEGVTVQRSIMFMLCQTLPHAAVSSKLQHSLSLLEEEASKVGGEVDEKALERLAKVLSDVELESALPKLLTRVTPCYLSRYASQLMDLQQVFQKSGMAEKGYVPQPRDYSRFAVEKASSGVEKVELSNMDERASIAAFHQHTASANAHLIGNTSSAPSPRWLRNMDQSLVDLYLFVIPIDRYETVDEDGQPIEPFSGFHHFIEDVLKLPECRPQEKQWAIVFTGMDLFQKKLQLSPFTESHPESARYIKDEKDVADVYPWILAKFFTKGVFEESNVTVTALSCNLLEESSILQIDQFILTLWRQMLLGAATRLL